MAEEMLTVYNDQMEPVGVAPRSQAHAQGLRHLVAHCWVISPREDGVWIWFQKRAKDKADFPGYYDIAVGVISPTEKSRKRPSCGRSGRRSAFVCKRKI